MATLTGASAVFHRFFIIDLLNSPFRQPALVFQFCSTSIPPDSRPARPVARCPFYPWPLRQRDSGRALLASTPPPSRGRNKRHRLRPVREPSNPSPRRQSST